MNKLKSLLATGLFGVAVVAAPVAAITGGEPDGEDHPFVGVIIFFSQGVPAGVCSGSLISPHIVLTAGHCTTRADLALVSFESQAFLNSFFLGIPHTHPDYFPGENRALPNINSSDIGVIVLFEPVEMEEYGALPDLQEAETLIQPGPRPLVTIVGYGFQEVKPDFTWVIPPKRHQATPMVLENSQSKVDSEFNIHISANPGKGRARGGSCFGDSGGPLLKADSNTILGVGSLAENRVCRGGSFYYRVDTAHAWDFLSTFLPSPKPVAPGPTFSTWGDVKQLVK